MNEISTSEQDIYKLIREFPGENNFIPKEDSIEKCTKRYEGTSTRYKHIVCVYRRTNPETRKKEITEFYLLTVQNILPILSVESKSHEESGKIYISPIVGLLESLRHIIRDYKEELNNVESIKNKQEELEKEIQEKNGNFKISLKKDNIRPEIHLSRWNGLNIPSLETLQYSTPLPPGTLQYSKLITQLYPIEYIPTLYEQQIELLDNQLKIFRLVFHVD